jgi:hypothetical protein
MDEAIDALRAAAEHPTLARPSRRPHGLDGHPGFAPLERHEERFIHHTDRDEILDHLASMSAIASLPSPRRNEVLARFEQILVRHGVLRVDVPQIAELWVTHRNA